VDLSQWSEAIDSEGASLIYGGSLADYNGSDIPEIGLVFQDEAGASLGTAGPLSHNTDTWTEVVEDLPIPANTRSISFVIKGTRTNGIDNDSYLDALFLYVDTSSDGDCDQGISETQPQEPDCCELPAKPGCACSASLAPGAGWTLGLLAFAPLIRRRRRSSNSLT
jgi:MYXO-CTERM domain-containing protein